MKIIIALILTAILALSAVTAFAEEEKTVKTWAYGAMPLNNGNVGIIYYTSAYYQLEGIVNPN